MMSSLCRLHVVFMLSSYVLCQTQVRVLSYWVYWWRRMGGRIAPDHMVAHAGDERWQYAIGNAFCLVNALGSFCIQIVFRRTPIAMVQQCRFGPKLHYMSIFLNIFSATSASTVLLSRLMILRFTMSRQIDNDSEGQHLFSCLISVSIISCHYPRQPYIRS